MFDSQNLEKYIEELKELVSIETPTGHKEGILKIVNFFSNRAEELGFKAIVRDYNQEAGPSLIITNAEENEDLDVLLLAHMDTVYGLGTVKNRPFNVNNNKAFGPGVADDKGGALLGIYALKYANTDNLKFAFMLNSNEEVGSIGNSVLIQELARKSKYTLVLEAAREDGSLVEKRYGTINYKIKFKGASSETQNPLDGVSVLGEMGNFIRGLNILNNVFRGTLLNFTVQESKDYKLNQVQDEITLGLQIRFLSHEGLSQVNEKIAQMKSNKQIKTVEINEEIMSYYPPLAQTDLGKDFKKEIWVAGRKNGIAVTYQTSFGGSDGSFASEAGSTVFDGLGPIGGKFHTEEEYLDLTSVESRCNFLVSILNKIGEK